jgi:hypothetical protein
MAKNNVKLDETWTLIASNVTEITFVNMGQNPIYIGFSVDGVTPPVADFGLPYYPGLGELKTLTADLTYGAASNYVWARTFAHTGRIFVETA